MQTYYECDFYLCKHIEVTFICKCLRVRENISVFGTPWEMLPTKSGIQYTIANLKTPKVKKH